MISFFELDIYGKSSRWLTRHGTGKSIQCRYSVASRTSLELTDGEHFFSGQPKGLKLSLALNSTTTCSGQSSSELFKLPSGFAPHSIQPDSTSVETSPRHILGPPVVPFYPFFWGRVPLLK